MSEENVNLGHISAESLEDFFGHPLRRESDTAMLDLHANVGRLEQSITNTNTILKTFISRTDQSIDRLAKSFEEVNKNLLISKQTNWGMIASWAAVLILLLGLVVYQPLQEIRNAINTHTQDGHPNSVIMKLENNISRIDGEITLLENADAKKDDVVNERVLSIEKWVMEHFNKSLPEHAKFIAEINYLTNELNSIQKLLQETSNSNISLKERIIDLEREIYTEVHYRSGRPVKTPTVSK